MIASKSFLLWSSMFTFSMLVEKGLKSTDVEVIQEARAKAKGKVITTIKYLKNALANGNFLLDEIEKFVQAAYEKLDSRHNTFQELHERDCYFRAKEKDPTAEAEAKEKEDSFSNQGSTDISAVRRELMKFKKPKEKEAEDSARDLEKKAENKEKEAGDSARALEIPILTKVKKQIWYFPIDVNIKKEAANKVIDLQNIDVEKTANQDCKTKITPDVEYSEEINEENISDILTTGATTDKLGPGTPLQCGPAWPTGPPPQLQVNCVANRGEIHNEDLEGQLTKHFKNSSPTFAANVPVDNSIDIAKKDVIDQDDDIDANEDIFVDANEDANEDIFEDAIEDSNEDDNPDIVKNDVKDQDTDKKSNEDQFEDKKPDLAKKDVKVQDVDDRDSTEDSSEDEINDKKPDIEAKFSEVNEDRSPFKNEIFHTDKTGIDPGVVYKILSTFQGPDKAVPNIMPVAGRASRFCLLEIVMKIVSAPEYGDVSKYLFTCKRLIIIYPKSLMKSIAMVTSVKDELPEGGSDVVSFKLNVFSLSLYRANRTSFVSLFCDTVASTSSLMCFKLYIPSLLVRHMWHANRRDMMLMVGDICLKDSNVYRGEWRMCEVAKVFPDGSGKVRNVEIMFKPKQSGAGPYISIKPVYLRRHVNNLIVIVPADEQEDQLGELQVGPQEAVGDVQNEEDQVAQTVQEESSIEI